MVSAPRAGDPGPAYTFSLRYIASPSFVFGSMPRTASSTSRFGVALADDPGALLAQAALVAAVLPVDLLVFLAAGQLDLAPR